MPIRLRLGDHAQARLVGRGIDLGLVKKVISKPDSQKRQEDGTVVSVKVLEDGRALEVVYRQESKSNFFIITFYFHDDNA